MPKTVRLQIPEPCHENWQQMTPNDQGRHCMACQKTVMDFSIMSDKEILHHISNASSSVCGRFTNDQLNKNIPIETNKRRRLSLVYLWNLLIATCLVTGKGYAQGKPVIKTEAVQDTLRPLLLGKIAMSETRPVLPDITGKIRGSVLDNDRTPVRGASIKIIGYDKGAIANDKGAFVIKWPKKSKLTEIEVSAVGYTTQTIDVSAQPDWNNLEILLAPKADVLDTVAVTVFGTTCRNFIAGGIGIVYQETKLEKMQNAFTDWLSLKKDMQVYPNPVIKGSLVNIKLNLDNPGEYKMELMDASGRVLAVQPVVVSVKGQSTSVPTSAAWGTGVYWIRLTDKKTKKALQSKVLIR